MASGRLITATALVGVHALVVASPIVGSGESELGSLLAIGAPISILAGVVRPRASTALLAPIVASIAVGIWAGIPVPYTDGSPAGTGIILGVTFFVASAIAVAVGAGGSSLARRARTRSPLS